DSQPVGGATVEVTSRETGASRQVATDARGRFTLLFPDGGGRYELVVRYIGMAPAQLSVARQGDEDRIVANVQMGLAAITMEAVSVTARRSGRAESVGRGATGQGLSRDEVARLPTDASELNTVPSLATADATTLDRLGVSPDSASRFRALAGATGMPAVLPGFDDRAGYNTLGLLRLDWQLSPVHIVTLRLDGHWISQEPTHVSNL